MDINQYERSRDNRRTQSELVLTRQAREELLIEWGATFHDIIEAIRANVRIKNQRRRTVSGLGTYDKWEEVIEKAGRKIKRTLLLQKSSTVKNYQVPHQNAINANKIYDGVQQSHHSTRSVPSVKSTTIDPPRAVVIPQTPTPPPDEKKNRGKSSQFQNARPPVRPPLSPQIPPTTEAHPNVPPLDPRSIPLSLLVAPTGGESMDQEEVGEEIRAASHNNQNHQTARFVCMSSDEEISYASKKHTVPVEEVDLNTDNRSLCLSDFGGTLSEIDQSERDLMSIDTREFLNQVENYCPPSIIQQGSYHYHDSCSGSSTVELDDIRRDYSCWELVSEDGPSIRRKVTPVIIYEDSFDEDESNAFPPRLDEIRPVNLSVLSPAVRDLSLHRIPEEGGPVSYGHQKLDEQYRYRELGLGGEQPPLYPGEKTLPMAYPLVPTSVGDNMKFQYPKIQNDPLFPCAEIGAKSGVAVPIHGEMKSSNDHVDKVVKNIPARDPYPVVKQRIVSSDKPESRGSLPVVEDSKTISDWHIGARQDREPNYVFMLQPPPHSDSIVARWR